MSRAAELTDQRPATRPRRPGPRLLIGALAAAAVLGILATVALGPRPPRLPADSTGDQLLADQLRALIGNGTGYRAIAVAVVDGEQVRLAGLGGSGDPDRSTVDHQTRFEVGSIGKVFTGMLLADLAEGGVVDLDQRVGDLVPATPLADAGDATLAELASHRSGLPRLSTRPRDLARTAAASFTGGDPYEGSPHEVLEAAARAGPAGGADYSYSNLGYATLGSALAIHQRMPYPDLLRQRLLGPLSMTDTVVVGDAAGLPRPRVDGVSRSGRDQQPWIADGYAPLGVGVWSTSADLARLAAAVLDGTAPGSAATQPQWPAGEGRRIGLGWFTSELDGRTVTWHNGGTGGFRSWLGVDLEAGRAAVVLAATTRDVDRLGQQLLTGETP
jgi:CubicO group peptidase (beta-lactamase class C family)